MIAANATNLPPSVRTQLNHDVDRRVREKAQWGGKWLGDQDPIESDYSNSPYGLRNLRELMKTYTESDPSTRHWTSEWSLRNGLWRGLLIERPDLAKWLAINQTVGPKLLDELADWPDPEVRGWVADHRRVWIKTLVRLASDPNPDVRRYATYNAQMPDAQLRLLATDSEPATRDEAQRRLEIRAFADRMLKDPEWWRYLGNSPF